MKQPPGGFNESLTSIFATILPRYTPNNPTRKSTKPSASSSRRGAIAGGVLGGLAALLLTAILIYLRRLRKRRAQQQGNIGVIPAWDKAEMSHDSQAKGYHEIPTDERVHELMPREVPGNEAVRYEMGGAGGDADGTVHELDAGRRRGVGS